MCSGSRICQNDGGGWSVVYIVRTGEEKRGETKTEPERKKEEKNKGNEGRV